jgi:hypothetical protein
MRRDNQPHRFYCGVDLHAKNLYSHVLDVARESLAVVDARESQSAWVSVRRTGSPQPRASAAPPWVSMGRARQPEGLQAISQPFRLDGLIARTTQGFAWAQGCHSFGEKTQLATTERWTTTEGVAC